MNNWLFSFFKSSIKLRVSGKNIERFIHKLVSKKIDLLEINYLNYKEVLIKVWQSDYEKILKIKTIYNIEQVNTYGLIKIKKIIKFNRVLIISILFGLVLLIILSNMIFKVEVVHTNKEIRHIIYHELAEKNISKFHFQKSYQDINKIKNEIILKHKDKIEWLEIKKIGTKYQIRVEERKQNKNQILEDPQNIIAKKSCVLKKITASQGEIIKNVNDYVNKGDIIISGSINLNEETKSITRALGNVYGEVWYKVTTTFPLNYKEIKYLNNYKKVYVIKFLNKKIELTLKPFNQKKIKEKVILNHPVFPFKLVYQDQEEIIKTNKTYTKEQALKQVHKLVTKKIESKLNDKEYIIKQKDLKILVKDSKIVVESFISVYEDVTDYVSIEPGEDNV